MGTEPGKKIRVMIADSNEALIESVRGVLAEDARVDVVATATTGAEIARKATLAKPLVLIMDLRFPDLQAPQVIAKLTSTGLPLAVLILSSQATKGAALLEASLKAGAFDFVKRPPNYKDVAQIGRQILTHVMVAAVSKSKQLPARAGGAPSAGAAAAAMAGERKLDAIFLEVDHEHREQLATILATAPAKLKAAVMVRVRAPMAAVVALAKELATRTPAPVYAGKGGDFLVTGRVCLVGDDGEDIVLERNLAGFIELKSFPVGATGDGCPSTKVLLHSLRQIFGAGLAAVLVGPASAASQQALAEAAGAGTLTLESTETDLPQVTQILQSCAK